MPFAESVNCIWRVFALRILWKLSRGYPVRGLVAVSQVIVQNMSDETYTLSKIRAPFHERGELTYKTYEEHDIKFARKC